MLLRETNKRILGPNHFGDDRAGVVHEKFRASEVINVRRPIRHAAPALDVFAQHRDALTFDSPQFREPLELLGIIAAAFAS